MKKIVSVGLNPAYDYTLEVDTLEIDTICRVQADHYQVAGKGADVAYCIAKLGGHITITGFLGKFNADGFQNFYKIHNVVDASVVVDGHIRTNVVVLGNDKTVTNLNSVGTLKTVPHYDAFINSLKTLADNNDMFVLAGSLCADNSDDTYYEIIKILKDLGKTVYLDTSGQALKNGIKANPDFIKPNLDELCELVGADSLIEKQIIEHARRLHKKGIAYVCVSMGADGLILVSADGVYKATPHPVDNIISTVGAGDAFVAGFAQGQACGKNTYDSIKQGMALSRAIVKTLGPRINSVADIDDNLDKVDVIKIG